MLINECRLSKPVERMKKTALNQIKQNTDHYINGIENLNL